MLGNSKGTEEWGIEIENWGKGTERMERESKEGKRIMGWRKQGGKGTVS